MIEMVLHTRGYFAAILNGSGPRGTIEAAPSTPKHRNTSGELSQNIVSTIWCRPNDRLNLTFFKIMQTSKIRKIGAN